MAIVVNLQLGRSLAAVCPHHAVVELLDETRHGVGDHASDLAHLQESTTVMIVACERACQLIERRGKASFHGV